ncbi:hypothetical protein BG011_002562 [Mortierella polycephala]|uniref:AFG1-like ATPase n=1 Tax=Mortierella polycephala TaxID=41804 RepID=A0A9P6Q5S3_9FUNG|nr:hypothetical protein BG011_002562 [Mortierella polycephala]
MTGAGRACTRGKALHNAVALHATRKPSHPSALRIQAKSRPFATAAECKLLSFRATRQQLQRNAVKSPFQPYAINGTPFISYSSMAMSSARRCMSTATAPSPSDTDTFDNTGPLTVYNDLIVQGSLQEDAFQRTIIETLQDMHDRLIDYHPEPIVDAEKAPVKERGLFSKITSIFNKKEEERLAREAEEARRATIPKGLYLHGNVGTGKTMLMDLFYNTLARTDKRRVHFHNFMLHLHGRLHQLKTTTHKHKDPIPFLADSLAMESRVLCLDEFQVTDIVDAMLLRRLLEELVVNRGVVLVTTSNRHPSELYKNGIQRESFLPGIAVLEENCVVKCLDGGIDYRREKKTFFKTAKPMDKGKLASSSSSLPSASEAGAPMTLVDEKRFFWPLGPNTQQEVNEYFKKIRNGHPVQEKRMEFLGRELILPHSAGNIAMCSFDDLCAKSLSAADYLCLAESIDTLILTNIPKLKPTTLHRNETRRMITLIDALYECQVKLVCSADGPISEIFGGGSGAHSADEDPSTMGELTPAQRQMMDDLGLNDVSQVKKSPIFSGEEEKFAVQRAESRLIEMQGPGWGL